MRKPKIVPFFLPKHPLDDWCVMFSVFLDENRKDEWHDMATKIIYSIYDGTFPVTELFPDIMNVIPLFADNTLSEKSLLYNYGAAKTTIKFIINMLELFKKEPTAQNLIDIAESGVLFDYSNRYSEKTAIEAINIISQNKKRKYVLSWYAIVSMNVTAKAKRHALEHCTLKGKYLIDFLIMLCLYTEDEDLATLAVKELNRNNIESNFRYSKYINEGYMELLEFIPDESHANCELVRLVQFNSVDTYYEFFSDNLKNKLPSYIVEAIKERILMDERENTIKNSPSNATEEKEYYDMELMVAINRLKMWIENKYPS